MFRTRFMKEIVAEFSPPVRTRKKARVIILCDGMPSIPRKQPLVEFLAAKGFWVCIRDIAERGRVTASFCGGRRMRTFLMLSMSCRTGWSRLRLAGTFR